LLPFAIQIISGAQPQVEGDDDSEEAQTRLRKDQARGEEQREGGEQFEQETGEARHIGWGVKGTIHDDCFC
jgi:hypothetical protein